MKKTKAERKERRKKIFKGIGRGLGAVAGVAIDLAPVPGVNKLIPAVVKPMIPQFDGDELLGESGVITRDIVPLIRTIKVLRDILERIIARFSR